MPKRKKAAAAKAAPKKKAKKKAAPAKKKKATAAAGDAQIVIEACKSWGLFKRESAKLKALLGEHSVTINPGWDDVAKSEKNPACRPRKGTFEVRVAGKPVVSLVGMPRPFKKLRSLEMAEVAKDVEKAC
jgi:hypothetical protein